MANRTALYFDIINRTSDHMRKYFDSCAAAQELLDDCDHHAVLDKYTHDWSLIMDDPSYWTNEAVRSSCANYPPLIDDDVVEEYAELMMRCECIPV